MWWSVRGAVSLRAVVGTGAHHAVPLGTLLANLPGSWLAGLLNQLMLKAQIFGEHGNTNDRSRIEHGHGPAVHISLRQRTARMPQTDSRALRVNSVDG